LRGAALLSWTLGEIVLHKADTTMKSRLLWLVIISLNLHYTQAQLHAVKEWSTNYDGPGHGVDLPSAVVLDRQGNFYITGRSSGENSGKDIATIKYSPSGQELLALRYNSPANSWDEGNSLAVDDSGNIFVTGTCFVTSSRTEIVLLKYSPAGNISWKSCFRPDTLNSVSASKIVLDSLGNIYLAGTFKQRMLFLKYDRTGILGDSATIGDDSTSHTSNDLIVARDGSIYLVGSRSYWAGSDVPEAECAVIKIGPSSYFGSEIRVIPLLPF
jgi:sugar lactone lactonase YvrE